MYPESNTKEHTLQLLKGWWWVRKEHGSLFDRGSADSYYGRRQDPHYGGVGGNSGERVAVAHPDEIAEYRAGYDYNERFGDKKEWR